ncbi:hypothetical protein [Gordonia sp. 'Campus']|uniref:hypothetical protein n=1 Tax=Gordonia sp. 'Campus' TaxID=2915824 RepID=UPI001EE462A6|nr:hypothetical protein [Gordonia sp. 'Campus']
MAALTLSVLLTGQWFSTAHAVAGPSTVGTAVTAPPADAANPYAATVVALSGPRPSAAVAVLPRSFALTQGYSPDIVDGYPIDPEGDCSSPVPLPADFTPLCRTHDFGYDLLRAAERDGEPLGPWARVALDRMLINRMYAACGSPGCAAAATAARMGLAWNTWRQRGGPPAGNESITALVTTTLERALVDPAHEAVRS